MKRLINWLFQGWDWWQRWFGPGTEDDWRNPFWRWFEETAMKVHYSIQTTDFRLGYYSMPNHRWIWWKSKSPRRWVEGVDANFYNGIFTYAKTHTWGWDRWGKYVDKTRFNIVIRLCHSWWFAFGMGPYPDKGIFALTGPWFFTFKGQLEHNPGCIAKDHEEGSV